MTTPIAALAKLTSDLRTDIRIDALLAGIVDRTAEILGGRHVSLRLLDDADLLLATCRAGEPMHAGEGGAEFHRGEGLVGWVAQTGSTLLTGDAEADPRFAQRPDQRGKLGSFVGVPLFDRDDVIGVLAAVDLNLRAFSAGDEQLLVVVAALCAPKLQIARLEELARRDELTSLLNRHGLRRSLRTTRVSDSPTSVVLVDLDHFKQVNDQHGHATGDAVLTAVAGALKGSLRGGDIVARYGGEEFLMVLPDASAESARIVAERARLAVANLRFCLDSGETLHVTLSAGVAQQRADEAPKMAIARADRALYAAKHAGRDRVVVATTAAEG